MSYKSECWYLRSLRNGIRIARRCSDKMVINRVEILQTFKKRSELAFDKGTAVSEKKDDVIIHEIGSIDRL